MHDVVQEIKGDGKPFVINEDGKFVTVEHETPITVKDTIHTRGGNT